MRILLIEDDPHDVFLIKELLAQVQSDNFEVTDTDRTLEAIKLLSNSRYDVILLDLSLADSKNLESFHAINQHAPRIPIVILTGNNSQELAVKALKSGAQDYLSKNEMSAKTLPRLIRYAIERKQIEEKLRETTDRLHLALSAARVGTWSLDIKTQLFFWDDYLQILYGLEPKSFSGSIEEALAFVHPEDRQRAHAEIFKSINNNTAYETEHRIIWPDGTMRILAKRGEVQYENNVATHLTGVSWDITERKKAEQWFHKHRFELANVSRINSMGEIASTLSHELNQPLTAITNFLQGCIYRLQNNSVDTAELLRALSMSAKQVERACSILQRIENFAHKGRLIYETVDLNTILKEATHLIYSGNENNDLPIQFELATNLPTIKIDRIQIQQVIVNLINNSIEAFQIANTEKPLITIATNLLADNTVEIKIVDNGPGFPEEFKADMFKPYFTTKQKGGGIGLAICRTIIQAHGGNLTAESPEEGGACFRFGLPVS